MSQYKVIFNQTNQRWAITKKPLLVFGNIEIYNDIYNYKEKETLIGDPVKALIHELIHASGISDENITQSYTEELLTDKANALRRELWNEKDFLYYLRYFLFISYNVCKGTMYVNF